MPEPNILPQDPWPSLNKMVIAAGELAHQMTSHAILDQNPMLKSYLTIELNQVTALLGIQNRVLEAVANSTRTPQEQENLLWGLLKERQKLLYAEGPSDPFPSLRELQLDAHHRVPIEEAVPA